MGSISFPRIGQGIAVSTVFALAFLSTNEASAQQATAQIAGTIRDASHAVVVGAKVTLKNSDTNLARSVTSNKDGDYLFTLVSIGTYEIAVEQTGFTKYVRKGITLEINQNAHLDVDLKIGATSQVVEVTGDVT